MNPPQSPGLGQSTRVHTHREWMGRYLGRYLVQRSRADGCAGWVVLWHDGMSTRSSHSSPVPGGSVVETAGGEVPRPRHPNTSYAWKRKEPIRARRPSRAVRAITAKHIHQFAQPFWGRISTLSLSCLLSRIKILVLANVN